jgi:selenocysteine lyase/cysteine desulfurase
MAAGHPRDGYDLAAVRADLPLLAEWTYLATGTFGVMPEPVLAAYLAKLAAAERGGSATREAAMADYEGCRVAVAALIGADPADVALNRNASDGIAWVTGAIELAPGDEVIASDVEGVELLAALAGLVERTGARVRFVPLAPDPGRLALDLRAATTARTRLVILSHVSCESGVRAPIRVVRDAVGPDPFLLVDAAQSVGVVPLELAAWRADAVISNGHKWLCGPKGTGFAWFASGSVERIRPLGVDTRGIDPPSVERDFYQRDPVPPARYRTEPAHRFEFGSRAWGHYAGLTAAIDYQAALGWENVAAHIRSLTDLAKERLGAVPGVRVVTPPPWEAAAGFVSFAVAVDEDATDLAARLREERILLRAARVPGCERGVLRASCAFFTSEEDIERLVGAVARLGVRA